MWLRVTQLSAGKSDSFAIKNQKQAIRCVKKMTVTVTVIICIAPVVRRKNSENYLIDLFYFKNLSIFSNLRMRMIR